MRDPYQEFTRAIDRAAYALDKAKSLAKKSNMTTHVHELNRILEILYDMAEEAKRMKEEAEE